MPAEPTASAAGRPTRQQPYPLQRLAEVLRAEVLRTGPAQPPVDQLLVTGVAFDSRQVRPGDLYLGLPGARTHGARFTRAAADLGAVALLTDPAGVDQLDAELAERLPVLVVDDPRRAMATAAAEVYGRPAERLTMLGVTGTNGKTTTSHLLAAGLRAAGRRPGVIGTLGYFIDDQEVVVDRTTVTTPESADLHALLALMAERGADSVVMEVSSHALALGRTDEVRFAVAGFTNFGEDHLDFHGDLEAYFEAKADLFTAVRAEQAVINIDDDRGAELVRRSGAEGIPVATTSLFSGSPVRPGGPDIDSPDIDSPDPVGYRCVGYDPKVQPSLVTLDTPSGRVEFRLALPGVYNVANALTAVAMLDRAGIAPAAAVAGLANAQVPGRLQTVDLGPDAPQAYVDFAHTPQAVRSVLTELRNITAAARDATGGGGRLICVVGCGGDRDPEKRRPMGAAAAATADVVIITDDNPRTEDPAAIRAEALAGARDWAAAQGLPVTITDGGDRASAIGSALALGRAGDVIALLGKGHERGQQIQQTVLPFDDVQQLIIEWGRLRSAGGERP